MPSKTTNSKKSAAGKKTSGRGIRWSDSRQSWTAARPGLLAIAGIALIALLLLGQLGLNEKAPAQSPLQISEVLSSNATTLFLADGSAPDWIEIRNTSDKSVNLAGYGLVPETAPTDIFTFSTRTLEPGAYAVVIADGNISAGDDHAPFRLSSGGGRLALIDRSGAGVDYADVPALENDQSYARDGDGAWQITDDPTPGAANRIARYEDAQETEAVIHLQEGELEISEIMPGSITWFADENGEVHDYIEIHNTSDSNINLKGWYLSDNLKKLNHWQFPDVTIPAGGYLAVHCSGLDRKDDANHLHTGFRLAAEGGTVVLTDPQGKCVSMVDVPMMEADCAYSRTASGWTAALSPSPNHENTLAGAAAAADAILNPAGVYISEMLASSPTSDDWVEIYNGGSTAVDLSGWGLSDNAKRPRKWQFPGGTTIAPGQYLGVYCDNLNTASDGRLHTNFALNADGGYSLTLSDPNGDILDRIHVTQQYADISYGRADGREGVRYFDAATPGAANSGASYMGRASMAEYSVRGGLYKSGDAFTVTLSAQPGQRIYYTLDCTDPTEASTLYTQPIPVSGTTILRTRVYADDCMPSFMDSSSYLYDVQNGGGSVHVLSLVSDPYNLVSDEAGIMVKGNHNNYWQDWEREAHVEVFDRQGGTILSQECAVRQQGQTSRDQPQQSLKLIAHSQYGSGVFEGRLFSRRNYDSFSSFIMRTSNDDAYNTRMRDSVLSGLADSADGLLYQETEVCVAYINGKYWGHYNLRETANTDFICQLEGWVGQEDEIDYVRGNSNLQQGSDETYQALVNWVKSNNTATDQAYELISSVIDVPNYIDYMIIEMFVGNTDPSDIKRYRNAGDDGLWRWVLFDLDWAFSTDTNSISRWLAPGGMGNGGRTDNTLFIACMKNPTFRDQFLTRFGQQLATTFSSQSMLARFEERYNVLKTILPDHHARWGTTQTKYENELRKLVSYANSRPLRLLQFFKYNSTLQISQQDFERYFGAAMQVIGVNYAAISRP